jgi:hypothetical protein
MASELFLQESEKKAVFRIRIRIDFGRLDPDSDPEGQKDPRK